MMITISKYYKNSKILISSPIHLFVRKTNFLTMYFLQAPVNNAITGDVALLQFKNVQSFSLDICLAFIQITTVIKVLCVEHVQQHK